MRRSTKSYMLRCTALLGCMLLSCMLLLGQSDTIILKVETDANDIEWFQYDSISSNFGAIAGETACSLIVDEPGLYYSTYEDGSCSQASCFTLVAFALNDTLLEEVILQTPDNTTASYQWLLDGIPISGATDHSLTTQDVGIYQIISDLPDCPPDTQSFCLLGLFPCMPIELALSDFGCSPGGGYSVEVLSNFDSMQVTNGSVNGSTISGIAPGSDLTITVYDTICDEIRDTTIAIPGVVNCHSYVNFSCGSVILPKNILTQSITGFEHFYTIELKNEQGLKFSNPPPSYVTGPFRMIVMNTCTGEMCESTGTIKREESCIVSNNLDTAVYCHDPFLALDPTSVAYSELGILPVAKTSCSEMVRDISYDGEWISAFPCTSDTAKLIERIWSSDTKDGNTCTGRDSIYVLRLPQLTSTNLSCPTTDTLFCGSGAVGPYLVFDNAVTNTCDTIYFIEGMELSSIAKESCGLSYLFEKELLANDGCTTIYSYDLTILQKCYGDPESGCSPLDFVGDLELLPDGSVVASCQFHVVDVDTSSAIIHYYLHEGDSLHEIDIDCDGASESVFVSHTNPHDCSAPLKLPDLCVELKKQPKSVKAVIAGVGTFLYDKAAGEGQCGDEEEFYHYTASSNSAAIAKTDVPLLIVVEVLDSCHQVTRDSIYTLVVDEVAPIVIASKGSSVVLQSDTVWVPSEDLHEGSVDNCTAVELLSRREDWQTHFFTHHLVIGSLDWLWTDGHDTLWTYDIESIEHAPKSLKHYLNDLYTWAGIKNATASHLLNLWRFAMIIEASQQQGKHHHPDSSFELFQRSFSSAGGAFNTKKLSDWTEWFVPENKALLLCEEEPSWQSERLRALSNKWFVEGGGWSSNVQFTCYDACGEVTVELLAIDRSAQVGLGWIPVRLDPLNTIQVWQELTSEVEISCSSLYETRSGSHNGQDLLTTILHAEQGEEEALNLLDDIFGSYLSADERHQDGELYFTNHDCECSDSVVRVIYEDPKLGKLWKDSTIRVCQSSEEKITLEHGLLKTVCKDGLRVESSVYADLNACGEGHIYREFVISQDCGTSDAEVDHSETITRRQRITVSRLCTDFFLENLPHDTTVYACNLTFNEAGQVDGVADPIYTGHPSIRQFSPCVQPLLSYTDKVYHVVGAGACQKIIRTWHLIDGCDHPKTGADEDSINGRKYQQEILVKDTTEMRFEIQDVTVGGTIITNGQSVDFRSCDLDFNAFISGDGLCSTATLRWQLIDEKGDILHQGEGELDHVRFEIAGKISAEGQYRLQVLLRSACGNEDHSTFEFELVPSKKPPLICISRLTAALSHIDSAHFAVSAESFVSKGQPACQDDSIFYRIEVVDGIDDLTWHEDDKSVLIACPAKSAYQVRVWAVSYPSLTSDYCDATLLVQPNANICADTLVTPSDEITISTLQEERKEIDERVSSSTLPISTIQKLEFDQGTNIEQRGNFALLQNSPNPFDVYTDIEFVLPASMMVELTITDITGQVLVEHKAHYPKGTNKWQVRNSQLLASGLLFYRLDAGAFHAMRKMVFVRD